MNRRALLRGVALAAACFLGSHLCAQAPAPAGAGALPLAERWLAALAPERDAPHEHVQELLAAAFLQPTTPAAALLASDAVARFRDVVDPAALLRWLDTNTPPPPHHGLLEQALLTLRHELARRGHGAAVDPYADRAATVAVVGPFGDAGRHFLDVPMPPDLEFPAVGQRLPGRFGDVAVRSEQRSRDRAGFDLQPRGRRQPGSYFVQWRVAVATAVHGFVEIDYPGACRCRVDGVEIGRSEPQLAPRGRMLRLPVRLAPGERRIVVKTGDDSEAPLALRLIDGDGRALRGITEIAAEAAATPADPQDPRAEGTFCYGAAAFLDGTDDDTPGIAALRTAAAFAAFRSGDTDRAFELLLLLDRAPPTAPTHLFALADLWRRATMFPDEQRTARARAFDQKAAAAVPPTHARAIAAKVREFEEKDQREQALRLLRTEIDQGRAGPETFAGAHAVIRRLSFAAEEAPLLAAWAAAVPTDPRPLAMLADRARELGDVRGAFAYAQAAFLLDPLDDAARRRAIDLALDLGDGAVARTILERALPATAGASESAQLRRALAIAQVAARTGDPEGLRGALTTAMAIDGAEAAALAWCADRWLQLGDDQQALKAVEAALARDPDQPALAELRARLAGADLPDADFARFRRDGDAAIAAFVAGPTEQDASSSLVVDQRIVEVQPDGSTLIEIHELRRINDQQGVETWRTAADPAEADELLVLRTVGKDGRTYMPTRVEGGFAMPRLEPGAFVEWRYRRRTRATGAEPWRLEDFLFGSHQEPLRLTEWVLILPDGSRGELRTRNLTATATAVALPRQRTAHVLALHDVARQPEEDSPPPADELFPIAAYGEDASPWPDLRHQRVQLLLRSRPTPPVRAFAATLLDGAVDDRDRLARIDAFCQREIDDGDSGDATEILLRKKGNRFLLAVALLRAGGIPFDPAACERVRSELVGSTEPMFAVGERAGLPCVRIRPQDAAPTWLFADSPRHWPLGAVAAHRSGALAFAIAPTGATMLRLPAASAAPRTVALDGRCTLSDQGTSLSVRAVLEDYTGFQIAEQLRRRTKDVQKLAARQIAQQLVPEWRIQQAAAVALEPGGQPLTLELELQRPAPQPAGAGRWLVPLPMPPADLRQMFGDTDDRTLPLLQREDLELRARIAIAPGQGRTFADLPPPLLVSFALLDYQLVFTRDGEQLVVERHLHVRPGTIPVALYADWIRTLAAIDRREQERLALVATTAPK